MSDWKEKMDVKEVSLYHRERLKKNMLRNGRIVEYYQRMLVEGIIGKELEPERISAIKKRLERLRGCNKFWVTETYEASKVKILLETFLCKDKFCCNCNQVRKLLLQERFLPCLEPYKDSLYHMVLTVPDCKGTDLRETIKRMSRCFKTLVTYLNGNKKVRGVDLLKYGYEGCIRSLEVTYKKEVYHPHFHAAVLLGNCDGVTVKNTANRFSGSVNRMFSEFELLIQRMWWLLMNGVRLTSDNILGENASLGRYSCIVDKFQPDDYKKLFGYMTKVYSEDSEPMSYENFKTLYYALERIRQIQGYGLFYNAKNMEMKGMNDREIKALENYLLYEESPVNAYEPLNRLAKEEGYTILRASDKRFKI